MCASRHTVVFCSSTHGSHGSPSVCRVLSLFPAPIAAKPQGWTLKLGSPLSPPRWTLFLMAPTSSLPGWECIFSSPLIPTTYRTATLNIKPLPQIIHNLDRAHYFHPKPSKAAPLPNFTCGIFCHYTHSHAGLQSKKAQCIQDSFTPCPPVSKPETSNALQFLP